MNVQFEIHAVKLHLSVNRCECSELLVSKSNDDQSVTSLNENHFEITATVPHNIELIFWLLERGENVKVLAPDCVKERLENGKG